MLQLVELFRRKYFKIFTVWILFGEFNHLVEGRTMSLVDAIVDDVGQ